MIKKNITNMVCCMLSERLATNTPNPENARIKRIDAYDKVVEKVRGWKHERKQRKEKNKLS